MKGAGGPCQILTNGDKGHRGIITIVLMGRVVAGGRGLETSNCTATKNEILSFIQI